jgi:hypothetical protein
MQRQIWDGYAPREAGMELNLMLARGQLTDAQFKAALWYASLSRAHGAATEAGRSLKLGIAGGEPDLSAPRGARPSRQEKEYQAAYLVVIRCGSQALRDFDEVVFHNVCPT